MELHDIHERFVENLIALERYFEEEFSKTPPLIYLSCDIRNSSHKLSVIDTNLFPAGFNNLCKVYTEQAVATFKTYLKKHFPNLQNLLIFSEAHTRNRFYFENLLRLSEILQSAGYNVRIAANTPDFTDDPTLIPLSNEKILQIYRLHPGSPLKLIDGWTPDLILSNNDFSNGPEPLLKEIQIPLLPPPDLGWYQRQKHHHFDIYNQVASEVGNLLSLDPWFLSCLSNVQTDIDFNDSSSIEKLAKAVDDLLNQIQKKYDEHQIEGSPYVFVKSNSGTYGMGVMSVSSGEEILNLNRKTRNKLTSTKGGNRASDFMIQEGIATADFYSGYPMEPVIYMVGEKQIGGFFRFNEEKDEWSSLNSRGMFFSCLCLHKLDQPHEAPFIRCIEKSNLVKLSYQLARIASLAAAREAALLTNNL